MAEQRWLLCKLSHSQRCQDFSCSTSHAPALPSAMGIYHYAELMFGVSMCVHQGVHVWGECVLLPLGMENQSFTCNFASALATTLKLPVSASPANLWAPCRWSCVLIIFAPSVPTESFLLNHMTRHKAWDKTPRESRCFSGPRSISHVSSSL